MFNKTTIVEAPRTEYVPYEKSVTVTESRAPTDDSIRLAKEYEEKIWKDIASRVTVDIPSIDTSYVRTEETHYDRARHIFFKINGKPVRVRYEYPCEIDQTKVYKEIAQKIAEEVMATLVRRI